MTPGGPRPWLRTAILLAPSLLVLLPFFLMPLAIVVQYSFQRFVPGGQTDTALTLENYRRFIADSFYRGILVRTLWMAAVIVGCTLVLAFPLAYTMARTRSRWSGVLAVLVLLPLMTSVVVRSYGWMILLAASGIVNTLLGALSLPRLAAMYNLTGVIIALTQVLMPYMVFSLTGVLQNVDPALEEAALSLGASRLRVFVTVILPLSVPGMAAGALLVFAQSISAFATPSLIGGAKVLVMSTTVATQAMTVLNWPFASAISVLLMLVVLALTIAQGHLLRLTGARPNTP